MSEESAYLKAILALLARKLLPPDELRKIVAPRGPGEKQVLAYNLCDGRTPRADIARATGLDASNLRKTLQRWEGAGVLINGECPTHLYRLETESSDG